MKFPLITHMLGAWCGEQFCAGKFSVKEAKKT